MFWSEFLMADGFTAPLPMCAYCQKPVKLETAWIDDTGEAIHAECYLLKLRREQAAAPPFEG
jgi:hypothetical protein